MQTTVYHIVMFAFADTMTADQVVSQVKAAQQPDGYRLLAEAVVIHTADGHVQIHEPGRGVVGGTIGAVTGGLLGLLGGPVAVLALAVAGGIAGGVAGHFVGRQIPAEDLKKLGGALPPNSSAFLVLVEDTDSEKVIKDLDRYNAQIVTLTVGDELSGAIETTVAADIVAKPVAADTVAKPAGPVVVTGASQPATTPAAGTAPAAPPSTGEQLSKTGSAGALPAPGEAPSAPPGSAQLPAG
jgi:uncharacterized membrane protein